MASGRPIEFDPDEVLNAAVGAFWDKGYEATSLQDLLQATNLSKSSLYQAFGGKRDLFGLCITRYTDDMVAALSERLSRSRSARGFIQETLTEIATEGAKTKSPRGCLIMNTASEFGQREADFAEWVDVGISRIGAVFEAAVKQGQKSGEFSRARSSALLTQYLMTCIAGLRTMVKSGAAPRQILNIVDVIVASLKH